MTPNVDFKKPKTKSSKKLNSHINCKKIY